jgi:hypothetical protein
LLPARKTHRDSRFKHTQFQRGISPRAQESFQMHTTFTVPFMGMVLAASLAGCAVAPAVQTQPIQPAQQAASPAVASPVAASPAISAFQLAEAQFVLDSAGFHGMAETLAEKKQIDAGYLSRVQRAQKVLAQAAWPQAMNKESSALLAALNQFAVALRDGKVDAAIKASDETHEAQHELSHAIDHWLVANAVKAKDVDPFNLSVAQYVMDSAGFHSMDDALNEKKQVDAGYLSKVQRVQRVLAQATWPAALSNETTALFSSLNALAKALSDNKVDEAAKAAHDAHEAQHELSHAVDHWLVANAAKVKAADPFSLSVVQYVMDSAGFHGMADALAEKKQIDAGYLSRVQRVQKMLAQATWPATMSAESAAFVNSLGQFASALSAGKVDDAIQASSAAHDAQHDLSHAIDHWLAGAVSAGAHADH